MLDRTGTLAGADEATARFCNLMNDFFAAAKRYPPLPVMPWRQKIRAWRKKKDEALVQRCLTAADQVEQNGFLLTSFSLSLEMRISYRKLHRLLESHPELERHLGLAHHPKGAPAFMPR